MTHQQPQNDHDMLIVVHNTVQNLDARLSALSRAVEELTKQLSNLPVWQAEQKNSLFDQGRRIGELEIRYSTLANKISAIDNELDIVQQWQEDQVAEQGVWRARVKWVLVSFGGVIIGLLSEYLKGALLP